MYYMLYMPDAIPKDEATKMRGALAGAFEKLKRECGLVKRGRLFQPTEQRMVMLGSRVAYDSAQSKRFGPYKHMDNSPTIAGMREQLNAFARVLRKAWYKHAPESAKAQRKATRNAVLKIDGKFHPNGKLNCNDFLDSDGLVINIGLTERYQSPLHTDNDYLLTCAVAIRH